MLRPAPRTHGEAWEAPGASVRVATGVLGALRNLGLPFLHGTTDTDLRALALSVRSAARRSLARPLAPVDARPEASATFITLGAADSVSLLDDNASAFAAKCEAICGAQRSVDCALYYLADDEAGGRFGALVTRAAQRGVRVRVGVDRHATIEKQYGPHGYATRSEASRGALALLDALRTAGCEVHVLGTDRWAMHRKFLFVDGERLVLGGRNVADHYVGARWRDLELDFRGPFAASCGSLVDATFDAPTARAPAVTGLVAGVPGRRGKAFIDAVTTLIEGAEATLDIEHAYLLSHAWLHEALLAAIARGVRVRAFSNSAESNDLSYMNWRLAMSLRALVEAGAEVYRRYSPSATLHTKLIVADGKRLVFGSSNLDYFSPAFCAELDVAIESASLGAAVTTWFERGLAEPTTRALRAGSSERRELERACSGWSVSRLCDLVLHDLQ